jgi:hypothetical protein
MTPQKGAQFGNSGTKMATEQRVNHAEAKIPTNAANCLAVDPCGAFVTLATASPKTFTAKGTACHHAEAFGELTRLAAENNRKVFTAYALVRIVHGECIELSAGTKVTIESADPSNVAICVRPSGKATCRWMSPELVDGLTPEGLRDAHK